MSSEIRSRPTINSKEVENALRKKFSLDELLESRVFVKNEGNDNKLNAVLTGFDTVIAPLRVAVGAKPFDLIVADGLLSQKTAPALAALDDGRMDDQLDVTDNDMCVTFSLHDMATLWAIDIPAVPATGLLRMSGNRLRRFCERFGWSDSSSVIPPIKPPQSNSYFGGVSTGGSLQQPTGSVTDDPAQVIIERC